MHESSYLEGRQDLLASMKRMPAFSGLPDGHLKKILSLSKIRKYDKGESIIQEGTFDSWMYCIISGTVRVEKGGRKIGEIHGAGAVFGEMGLIDGSERSASVRAHAETMCLAVDASFLDRMEETERASCYSVLYRMFVEILAERLRTTSAELAEAKEKMAVLRKKIVDGA